MRHLFQQIVIVFAIAGGVLLHSSTADAHFPWIVLPTNGSQEFAVVFSEDMQPDDPTYLKNISPYKARLHSTSGSPIEVALTQREDRLIGLIPAGMDVAVIELPFTWGIFSRGDSKFLLRYRAMAVLNVSAAAKLSLDRNQAAGPLLSIDKESDRFVLNVVAGDKPMSQESIRVQGPNNAELVTDAGGKANWRPTQSGVYGLTAKSTLSEKGEWKGEAYPEVRNYTTLVMRVERGFEVKDGEPDNHSATTSPSKFAPLPIALTSFGAARVGDAIYVYGGHTGSTHSYSVKEQSNQMLRLDLKKPAAQWETVSEGPRLQGLALVAHRNRLIRIGGFTARNESGAENDLHSSASVSAFDTITNTWNDLPSLPEPRSSHDAVAIGDIVYVAGGWNMDGSKENQWQTTAYAINLLSPSPKWTLLPEPNFVRRALALATHQGKLYAIGGMGQTGMPTTETEVFDTTTGKWTDGPSLVGEGMAGFGSAAINIDGHLIVGTLDGNLQQLSDNGSQWKILGKTKDARFFHRLLPLADHSFLAVGGANMGSGKFLELEEIHAH